MAGITATTTSKVRADLTAFLKEVTTKELEVHIVTQTGKNAVLISEDVLNELRSELEEYRQSQALAARKQYLTDAKTPRFQVTEEMHQDILGDLYDQLPE